MIANKLYRPKDFAKAIGPSVESWKRWTRELIPPDPKAGHQCGYPRLISIDDAFKIFFCLFYLVYNIKFTIFESKQIWKDIEPWLKKQKFIPFSEFSPYDWRIGISPQNGGFAYTAKYCIERKNLTTEHNVKTVYERSIIDSWDSDGPLPPGSTEPRFEILLLPLYNSFKKTLEVIGDDDSK